MVENPGSIDALLQEERTFPPSGDFVGKANMADPGHLREGPAGPRGVLGRSCRRVGLVPEVGQSAGVGPSLR